jgi:arylsulfatase A-like enzyme
MTIRAALLFSSILLCQCLMAAPDTTRPNVIVILADDLGFGDVGANNPASKIPTPAMDRLATEGMKFTDAHSPSAVCTPTRYSLLTGRYCWRSRLKRGVLWGIHRSLIDPNRSTIADLLKTKGYRTACIGKWHLGMDFPAKGGGIADHSKRFEQEKGTDPVDYSVSIKNSPLAYGFDQSYVIAGSLNMYPYTYINGDRFVEPATEFKPRTEHNISIISGGPKAPNFDFEAVIDVFNQQAVDFIESASKTEQPFFLYFPLTAPHKPVLPTSKFKGKSKLGIYGDFVMQVDDSVAQILGALDTTKQADNTIVLLTSDNGSFMFRTPEDKPDHVSDFKVVGYHPQTHQANGVWRGTKADVYEAGHRVPHLVRWPAAVKAKTTSLVTTTLTDWYATLAEIVGHELEENEGEDSISLLPVLHGETDWKRPPVINHSINGTFAIRDGKWKLIASNGSGGRQAPKGQPFQRPYQLYNLNADPSESNNVISSHPEIANRLEEQLNKIREAHRSR